VCRRRPLGPGEHPRQGAVARPAGLRRLAQPALDRRARRDRRVDPRRSKGNAVLGSGGGHRHVLRRGGSRRTRLLRLRLRRVLRLR